ncbi:M23 family metallopeptidase [Pantanalinema rosaneae CENA516]|uniref:M23 family metallopeptidase n=1 Tax=Pantanalinema rosaneae TaxID=1620701 RepID=UPI003D70233A
MPYQKLIQKLPQIIQSFACDRRFPCRPLQRPKASLRIGQLVVVGMSLLSLFTFSTRQTFVVATESHPQPIALGNWQGASFPVENFQLYTSPFGLRQAPDGSYTQEYHRGLDMAAPEGSYIRNWWTGKVVEVSDDSACGTSVVVESGQWEHIYCHMRGHVESANGGRYMIDRDGGIQIWEGQTVQAGVRIGRVGMTGRTTGPHLHWGLKYGGQWVDPALVLRAMYAEQTGQGRVSRK